MEMDDPPARHDADPGPPVKHAKQTVGGLFLVELAFQKCLGKVSSLKTTTRSTNGKSNLWSLFCVYMSKLLPQSHKSPENKPRLQKSKPQSKNGRDSVPSKKMVSTKTRRPDIQVSESINLAFSLASFLGFPQKYGVKQGRKPKISHAQQMLKQQL